MDERRVGVAYDGRKKTQKEMGRQTNRSCHSHERVPIVEFLTEIARFVSSSHLFLKIDISIWDRVHSTAIGDVHFVLP